MSFQLIWSVASVYLPGAAHTVCLTSTELSSAATVDSMLMMWSRERGGLKLKRAVEGGDQREGEQRENFTFPPNRDQSILRTHYPRSPSPPPPQTPYCNSGRYSIICQLSC
ncbi:unnamed protein product [Pleuronectes platessa]|uniref:Secreted protein n=1 Tax=Pleuronectes platessa TaxID=8262 RepID=A0A9N7YV45_PLEPL|nr:unnamed protein product [Pleuronectes platessa]